MADPAIMPPQMKVFMLPLYLRWYTVPVDAPLIPHRHIDRRLLLRLSIFLVIALGIVGIVLFDILSGELSWWLAVLGFVAGLLVGYVLGRLLTVKWHEGKRKAVTEMDIAGFVALGVYILLRLSENWLLGHWFTGAALSTLSLAVLGGALFGRFLGLRMSVMRLIEENAG